VFDRLHVAAQAVHEQPLDAAPTDGPQQLAAEVVEDLTGCRIPEQF
jgi:hypothetical protein